MSDDRMIIAIGRIERALSRIEAAQAPAANAFKTLQDRHAQLRGETAAALAELNLLVERLGESGNGLRFPVHRRPSICCGMSIWRRSSPGIFRPLARRPGQGFQ